MPKGKLTITYEMECARRGAELLDDMHPGWHQYINLEILDIASGTECILGQLYGHWANGLEDLRNTGNGNIGLWAYGFNGDPAGLAKAWRSLITQRSAVDSRQESVLV